jgi:hypothetical protein
VIVISGVLLVLAVIFLVIGLFAALGWIYASIAAALVAFVFLLIALRQRQDVLPAQGFPRAVPEAALAGSQPSADSGDVTIVASSQPTVPPEPVVTEHDSNVDEGVTLIPPPAGPAVDDAVPDFPAEPARPRPSAATKPSTARKRTAALPAASTKTPVAKRAAPGKTAPAKQAATKKAAAAKPPAKQAAAAPAKKAAAKPAVKKAAAKQASATAPVKKTATAKRATKKAAVPVKKATKQAPAKRSPAKRTIASETEFLG